MNIGASVYEYW